MRCAAPALARVMIVLIIASAGMTQSAAAQDTASKGPAAVYGLDLKEHAEVRSGKVAGAGGTVDRAGHRFQLEHLDLQQPIAVAVIAGNPSRRVEVRLAKYNFDNVERQGRTDGAGHVSFRFRTEGDLRILVRAATDEPTPYSLVVWVGEEIDSDIAAPFVPMKTPSPSAGVPWAAIPLAAGVLGGLACAVAAVRLRRPRQRRRTRAMRQSGVALAIVGLCAGLSVLVSASASAQPAAERASDRKVTALASNTLTLVLKDIASDIGSLSTVADAAVALKNFPPLSALDTSLDAANDAGMPDLPSNCLNSEACRECFAPAHGRLKRVLRTLERLRRIGAYTKAYTDRAIAFGASMASLQGAGLGWPAARTEIEQSYLRFQNIYDSKYTELIASLKSALQDIAACEETVYQEKNWYHRFGFIYYEFIAERYRRKD